MRSAVHISQRVISLEELAENLCLNPARRQFVAIAGAPGAGKTTAAKALLALLTGQGVRSEIVQMDGFHYDDAILNARGLRPRKGAPETFDVGGLESLLKRLRDNQEQEIAVPIFDRELEISRAAARVIEQTVNCVIVEGNYLLLQDPPWSALAKYFDHTVMLKTARDVRRARLVTRWKNADLMAAEIADKVEGNDLKNGELVVARSAPADFIIETDNKNGVDTHAV